MSACLNFEIILRHRNVLLNVRIVYLKKWNTSTGPVLILSNNTAVVNTVFQ